MWIMCVDTWEKLGRSAYGEVLKLNEWIGCFPTDKWRLDKTDPHCSIVLPKVFSLLICKLRTDFTAESQSLCMGCPPTRAREQKKKIQISLSIVSASAYERMSAYSNVYIQSLIGRHNGDGSLCIYILHDRHRYKLHSSIIVNRKIWLQIMSPLQP